MFNSGGSAPAQAEHVAARKLDDNTPKVAELGDIAPNPLNTRVIDQNSTAFQDLVKSLEANGQLAPCAVVPRVAFVAIYPEYAEAVVGRTYVQANGGQRYVVTGLLGRETLKISVQPHLAESRLTFLQATFAENFDRINLNPIETARAVAQIVNECGGNQTAAAESMTKSKGWVTQQLNLLKLCPDLQAAVASGEVKPRAIRDAALHESTDQEQLAWLQQYRENGRAMAEAGDGAAAAEPGPEQPETEPDESTEPAPEPDQEALDQYRRRRLVGTVKRLGTEPQQIAASLATALEPDRLLALYEALRETLGERLPR